MPGAQNTVKAVAGRAMAAFSKLRDAMVFAFAPPAVLELGVASGFDMYLRDRAGAGHEALMAARNQLLGMAAKDPILVAVRPNGQEDTPQFSIDVDTVHAGALGLAMADVNATLSAAWGSAYVNDFIDKGRVKKVYMQADAPFRMVPEDLSKWYAQCARRHGSFLGMFARQLDIRIASPRTLQRRARRPDPGAGRDGSQFRRGNRGDGGLADNCRDLESRGPDCPTKSGCPVPRRRCSTGCRSSSCSCVLPRCMRAGRFHSRCC